MFSFKLKQTGLVASVALFAAVNAAQVFAAPTADPVVLTFSTVGDSRQDPTFPDPSLINKSQIGVGNCQIPTGTGLNPNPGLSGQDCKWLQNTAALSMILDNIHAEKAKLLFFNGDMIMGYGKAGVPVTRGATGATDAVIASPQVSDITNSDLMQFYKQYGFWRGMVATLMEKGTYVVPVPGNHETQCKRCGKASQVENENAWRDNMGDLILDTARFKSIVGSDAQNFSLSNTPVISGPDSIKTDQSQLSYSFDVGNAHFAVINTDPVGHDGYAPTAWLSADLDKAKANGATSMFVFGHKSAFFYGFSGSAPSSTSSLNNKDAAAAEAFWDVIVSHKATYFCGHEHIYHIEKIPSSSKPTLSAYQVLVGSGGSPFETSVDTGKASDRVYAWATVQIHQSGKAVMTTYGFDPTMANPVKKLDTSVVLNR